MVEGAPRCGVPSQDRRYGHSRPSATRSFVQARQRSPDSVSSSLSGRLSAPGHPSRAILYIFPAVDRRLAYKNLRTALIAGSISLIVFALSWVVGLIY